MLELTHVADETPHLSIGEKHSHSKKDLMKALDAQAFVHKEQCTSEK